MTMTGGGASVPGTPGLNLTVEQQEAVEDTIAALVGVNVYRQLKAIREQTPTLRDTGCQIIGNCCSCSKAQ